MCTDALEAEFGDLGPKQKGCPAETSLIPKDFCVLEDTVGGRRSIYTPPLWRSNDLIMAAVSDKARFYLEQLIPELKEYEQKRIFSKVSC
jgi:hypothetical protein